MKKVSTLVKKSDIVKLKSYYGEALNDACFKSYVNNIDLPAKLFNEIAPKYAGKNVGGYTRIVKAGPRRGDGAEVAILQLI